MPHPLNEQIDRLTARLRRRGWLTGWLLVGLVLLGVAALLVGLDYATRWSDAGVRWLASGVWLAAIGWAVHRFLVRPRGAAERPARGEVAHRVERHFPSLGSRLTSSLEFLRGEEDDASAGSAELRRAVISQTRADANRVDFDAVIDRTPLRRVTAGLGWLAALVALATLLAPAAVATGLARLAAPWSSVDWPRRNQLAFVDPPTRVARGQDFEAVLIDNGGIPPEDAQIIYRFQTTAGRRTERRAAQSSGDKLLAVLEDVQQPFAFRATGGDDFAMPWIEVEVVDPPALASLAITATPPAYSGLPAGVAGPDLRVLAGTSLAVEATAEGVVAAAELLVGEAAVLPLKVGPGKGEAIDSRLSLADSAWIVEATEDQPNTTTYHFRLEGKDGVFGETVPQRLRVEPDKPPRVAWGTPASDVFVTAQAVVPIAVEAEDNLAVRRIRVLVSKPSSAGDEGEEAAESADTITLFEGAESPPQREEASLVGVSERQTGEADLDLATLALPVGVTLELTAEAEDYRPGIGRTRTPRRVTIISDEEFNQRVADAQTQLLRDLQQALDSQRGARDKNRDIATANQTDKADEQTLLDRLSTLGFDQRRVGELIADPERGVARQAERLLKELAQNRVDRPGLASQLQRVAEAARGLADRPLPEAARGVVDAQRSAESGDRQRLADSLAGADRQQTEVIEALEQLTDEMAGWSDLEQFARELADLQQRQQSLVGDTQADAAKTAAGRRSPAEREADRKRIAEAQSDLARRFDKLMRSMRKRIDAETDRQSSGDDPEADRLAPVEDTIAEAEDRATTGKLRDATRQIRQGRLGRAGEAQQQAAEDLQELLETLRDRASNDPAALADQLRKSQERLNELQEQLERFERRPDGDPRRQTAQQKRLAEQTERLSRKLDRLTADKAADSAATGAQQIADAAQQAQQQGNQQSSNQQPNAQQSRQQAQEQLKLAEEQIEERIRQLESEIAQRLLEQLATDVQEYLKRQQRLLRQTVELADNTPPDSPELTRGAEPIAGGQGRLGEKVDAAAEKFAERKVFSLALDSAATEMQSAAERLSDADPGRRTQQHELEAIERLKHIADALTPTPPEEQPENDNQQQGGGGGQQQQQPPPPFDVAELKMLRLMQLDLNSRTRRFEAAAAEGLPGEKQRQEARRLATEQRELADLVQELMNRNNKDSRLAPPKEVL